MGRAPPSWIKKGAHSSHATVLHATVLHAIAALVRRQCVPEGDSAVPAHRSALHAKDARTCLRLIGSCERCVRASHALDSVLRGQHKEQCVFCCSEAASLRKRRSDGAIGRDRQWCGVS